MIGKFLTTVKVRSGPSTSSDVVEKYNAGETVRFDRTVENEGRLWISYIGRSGNRRYCCARDVNGEVYISLGNGGGNNGGNVTLNQKSSRHQAVRKEGCCFLCACYLGGLNTIDEADDCFEWAVSNGKVRKSDSYVNVEKHGLANEIAQKYGRSRRSGTITKGNNHFFVMNGGREVFNSISPGYGH